MKAFTLMEVMVAVSILSVMSLTLLQVRTNNTHLNEYFLNKNKASSLMSLVAYNYDETSHNKNLHLDDAVQKSFKIDDDLRVYLKEFDLMYENKILSTIDLLEDKDEDKNKNEDESENKNENEDETEIEDDKPKKEKDLVYAIKIRKIYISDDKLKDFFYTIGFK